ncbi:MAG: methyl-accepting chemotaxis protein [Deltaproteobacteria bacterium]|nr:methyl-accepting chemotaxis protein [Deltaproteobacteria bacterium]
MFRFFSKSLMNRLVGLFFLTAVIPIAIVVIISFYYSDLALERAAFNQLSSVNQIKKDQIIAYLKERMEDLSLLSKSRDVRDDYALLLDYHDAGGGDPNGAFDVSTKAYRDINEIMDPFFREYLDVYQYRDIFFICKAHGHVMYTAQKEDDLGTNLQVGPYRDSGLAKLWAKVLKKKKAVIVDFTHYAASNVPVAFVGAPVTAPNGNIYAVLALQLDTKKVNAIMQERTGMGETGETYLVGEDFLMRSDSRFSKDSTILKRKVDTAAVRQGLKHGKGLEVIKDYRGEKVLSCYSHLGLNEALGADFDWVIVSEIDESEAFAPIRNLGLQILWVGLLLAAVAAIVGYVSARFIAMPLKNLSEKVKEVSDGDLTVTMTRQDRMDEVGVLMNAFHNMLEMLRTQTRQIIEGSGTIASSISQISTTASQLAASASETSSSVSEITTTVEEVKQTAYLSNEKSGQMAQDAEKATEVSRAGTKATQEAIKGINFIKEEMEDVANSIVKLSEQTQSIGEIIAAVNDLADQSNLLSVNASIEAAKAGELGKGFAVVAQEVKSLADQSKEATNQVRTILNDIQKATSAAVMATERGTKAVGKGVELSAEAGESINALAESVSLAANASLQISTSSEQQLIGMDQLADAMESIKEASIQNVDGAKQLEAATRSLEDLGRDLKALAEQFRV